MTTVLAAVVVTLVLGFVTWRTLLPNNQHRILNLQDTPDRGADTLFASDGYDDVITLVTARNFARDGFLRTHFLPNRGGAPQVSLYDRSETQCEAMGERASSRELHYMSPFGQWVRMVSAFDDCIYGHYPPLADWFYGAIAVLGGGGILQYRLAAIALNGVFLVGLFLWLRREVDEIAAGITLVLTATMPAFVQWADALFFHPFQYPFLVLGLLSWSLYLSRPRRAWLVATWALFFGESLTSYDLILFFGLGVLSLTLLDEHRFPWRMRFAWIAALASAPVAAVLLHFGLRISLFGVKGTLTNALETLRWRIQDGVEWGIRPFSNYVEAKILPWSVMAALLFLTVALQRMLGRPMKRPLVLLAVLAVGGASYTLLFPGTSLAQPWMKYRHFLPLAIGSIAFSADGLVRSVRVLRTFPRSAGFRTKVCGLAALGLSAAFIFSGVVWRNAQQLRADAVWHVSRNRHHDGRNQAQRFLETLYWQEKAEAYWSPRLYMPVDGRRVNNPRDESTRFAMRTDTISHYEIWWLDAVEVKTVRILTDPDAAKALMEDCVVTLFDGTQFTVALGVSAPSLAWFEPDLGESEEGYLWVQSSLPASVHTRAARFTCGGSAEIPLYEIEVLAG